MGYEGKGIITEECHALVHNLVVAQVGVEHIEEVIHLIANTLCVRSTLVTAPNPQEVKNKVGRKKMDCDPFLCGVQAESQENRTRN